MAYMVTFCWVPEVGEAISFCCKNIVAPIKNGKIFMGNPATVIRVSGELRSVIHPKNGAPRNSIVVLNTEKKAIKIGI